MRLAVAELRAWYGPAPVLFGLALEVGPGEVVALLGRNGAGKSTLLKAIMGLVTRTGTVQLGGGDLSRRATHEIARAGLGYVPEDRRVFTDLTVDENLAVARRAAPAGLAPWTPDGLFRLFPNLAAMRDRRGGEMSGGEQQMLTIARTLMAQPRLLLLDEPSEGLAPRIVGQMAEAVRAMKAEGIGILLSEQNLAFARRVADRAVVIEGGRHVFSGPFAALDADPALRAAHLAV